MPADIDGLTSVAGDAGVLLLFDAAAAVGVQLAGTPLAAFGDGAAYSFHATKVLGAIECGAVTSRHRPLLERLRQLRNFGMGPTEKAADSVGFNGKANEVVSAVGLLALDGLEQEVALRGRHLERYRELLEVPWATFLSPRHGTTPNNAACAVRLRTRGGQPLAAAVNQALHSCGIGSRRYYAGRYAVDVPGETPEADRAREDVLCLPLWGQMTDQTIERVCTAVRDAVNELAS